MTPEAFAEHYPRLYHMTAAGGWEGIKANGLRTTRQLLTDAGADEATVEAVAFARRTEQVELAPGVTIRDNKVLNETSLAKALTDGLTPRDWYGLLNERVFLWANPKRRLPGGRGGFFGHRGALYAHGGQKIPPRPLWRLRPRRQSWPQEWT